MTARVLGGEWSETHASATLRRWWNARRLNRVGLSVIAGLNVVPTAVTIAAMVLADVGYDWVIYVEAGERVLTGTLFDWEGVYAWSYSPVLAYVFMLVAPIGYWGWTALHFAALAALRDRWLVVITLASWPFWSDVYAGNTITFVFVAAAATIRGSSWATAAYLILCLLMPRPLMLPVLLWVLWRRPPWRPIFAGMVLVNLILVVASGYGWAWIEVLAGVPEAVAATTRNIGPSAIIGGWWLVIGLPLADTSRGEAASVSRAWWPALTG